MKLPLAAAVAATSATLIEGESAPDRVQVSTDTRSIEPGDTFLALRGAIFDGHDFVAEAVRKGAAMLVIDRPDARVTGTAASRGERNDVGVHGVGRGGAGSF